MIRFRILVCFLVFVLGLFQPIAVIAQNTLQDSSSQGILYPEKEPQSSKKGYSQLMREFRIVQTGKETGSTLSEQERGERTKTLRRELEAYLADEKENLGAFSLFDSKKNAYIAQLEAQIRALGGAATLVDKIVSFVQERVFGQEASSVKKIIREPTKDDFSVPDRPSRFSFPAADSVDVKRLSDSVGSVKPGTRIPEGLEDLITIQQVEAGERPLPVIEDVLGDTEEVLLTQNIQDLAARLGGNPVSIFNYLSGRLRYDPYYGAKKGAAGCLAETLCNDVDATSLSIALMRASGIPAHYKKSVIVVTQRNLKDLLGVEDVKAAFAMLALKKVPIFTLSGVLDGKKLDEVDLSKEKAFALEWVYPELYYEYDERGANVPNTFSMEGVTTTPALQEKMSQFPKKEWIPFDVIFAPLTHTKGDAVPSRIGFDTGKFFVDYLKDTRMIAPLTVFSEAVERASGKNIQTDTSTHSVRVRQSGSYSILPLSLPYIPAEGVQNGQEITIESWSRLPNERKAAVTITLLESGTKATIFEKKFFGSDINNIPLTLAWQGASALDQELIDQYGGVHLVPATRVRIVPLLEGGKERHLGTQPVSIGQSLITRFSYTAAGGQEIGQDEKFSIAGNQEGIFISLSRTLSDPSHATVQHILVEGQTGIARAYLLSLQESSDALAKIYDHVSSIDYTRAVVTQNRILSEVNSSPTTFEFSGLTIDASSRISDFSARGTYKENQSDFRRILGLSGSYFEHKVFENITGLSGISTVKGLSIAHQKPDTYRIHTITGSNAGEIDTLQLSENTKRVMRDDVAKGWTIITPNKLVEDGAWKGVLYISLNPDGTGQYAIGEQTGANGGWTTSQLLQYLYVDGQTKEQNGFLKVFGSERFYFEDTSVDTVLCRIRDAEYTVVTKAKDWKASYGHPCNIGTVRFSGKEHSFVQASNASKFYRENAYDYWDYKTNVVSAIDEYIKKKKALSLFDDQRIGSGEKFTLRFSLDLGTYLQTICEMKVLACSEAVAYYVPGKSGTSSGGVTRVRDRLYARLSQDNNELIKKIGFPTSDDARAAASEDVRGLFEQVGDTKDSFRKYQNFFNGQLYTYFSLNIPRVFYTYGPFTEKHNAEGGTRGKYGFPVRNPEVRGTTVVQLFERKHELAFNTRDNAVAENKIKKFACKAVNPEDSAWYDVASYFGAELSGFLDASADAIDDTVRGLAQLPWVLANAVIHFGDTVVAAQTLIDELKNVNADEVLNTAKQLALESTKEAIKELTEITSNKGCNLRVGYLTGFVVGAVANEFIPSKKIGLPEKLAKLARGAFRLPKTVKVVERIGNHGMRVDFKERRLRLELESVLAEKNWRKKGDGAEQFFKDNLDPGGPMPLSPRKFFKTDAEERRFVDFYDENSKNGHYIANEVKGWTTDLDYTGTIKKQIDKDIKLMNERGDEYIPVWHFMEGEPTQKLKDILDSNGIAYVLYGLKK